ncbi:hypothetical protein D3C83_146890 [compost metagenome]
MSSIKRLPSSAGLAPESRTAAPAGAAELRINDAAKIVMKRVRYILSPFLSFDCLWTHWNRRLPSAAGNYC